MDLGKLKILLSHKTNKMSVVDITQVIRVNVEGGSEDDALTNDFVVVEERLVADCIKCSEVRMLMPAEFTVAAKLFTHTESTSKHVAIAYHGWLDNANSMSPVALELLQRLPSMFKHILCVDYPGCGLSENRSATYQALEGVYDLCQVVGIAKRNLNADGKVTCIGHSYGGAQMMVYASIAPDQVERLIILDIFGYLTVPPDKAMDILKRNIANRLKVDSRRNKARKVYATKDKIIDKLQSRFPYGITREAATLLIERGAIYNEERNGWQFTYDPYHIPSWFYYLSEDHLSDLLKGIQCPVLLLWTTRSLLYNYEQRKEQIKRQVPYFKEVHVHTMKDRHHFHMEDPILTASIIVNELTFQTSRL